LLLRWWHKLLRWWHQNAGSSAWSLQHVDFVPESFVDRWTGGAIRAAGATIPEKYRDWV